MSSKAPESFWQLLGPGLVTGASDDDPSGIGTYSQAGAQFGTGMLWTMLFAWPLMSAIQEISARVGRTTGVGIAANLRKHYPKWFSLPIVGLLLIANTINIAADLGAMGSSLRLLIGGPALLYCALFAAVCFAGTAYLKYKQYSSVLKYLTVVLLAYVIVAFVVKVPWATALHDTFVPSFSTSPDFIGLLVAILGTTISPYLFFWQASEEAEEVRLNPEEEPLKKVPEEAPQVLKRIRIDTYIGMALSNAVAWSIMLAAAFTLHARGQRQIESAQQAAEALRPVAGNFAFALFAVGIIGTGLLAVPVLAASSAYAVGEEFKKRVGIDYRPKRAPFFYGVFGTATILGLGLNFTPINPIKALVWSAVINGVVAVPVMVALMLMVKNRKIMGDLAGRGRWVYIIGWIATAVMTAAVIAMFVTMFR